MKCRACESPNRPGARYCHRCSAPLSPSCLGCGAALTSAGELCSTCRTDQVPEPIAEELFALSEQEITSQIPVLQLRPGYTGRKGALDSLVSAFQDTRDLSELSFLLLVGEPGMGKSRTLKEFARQIKESDPEARVLVGSSDGASVTYVPIAQILSARFGITASSKTEERQERIIAGVTEVLPAGRVTEVAHLLAHLMAVPFPDSPIIGPLSATPKQLQARIFIALRRFLEADAKAGPLVLCFENLELCETETINLLHYLAAGLASAPVVICGTARNSLFDRHPSFGEGETPLQKLELGPLTADESRALWSELCADVEGVPDRLLDHVETLGGSPRALFELMHLLQENGVITLDGETWKIDERALSEAGLPASHEEVVSERVRCLATGDRGILGKAAAVGETFWLDSVVALVRVGELTSDDPDGPTLSEIAAAGDHTRAQVAKVMSRLVDAEWLEEVSAPSIPGEREYRFAYPHLWSSVYASLDEIEKCGYHKLIAQWLELRPEGRTAVNQEDVAAHLELAGDVQGAATRYRRAADAARKSFFNGKAIRLYARALGCLGDTDLSARIHLWHDLGSVYELVGDFEAALGGFERMLRLAWVCAARSKAAVAFNKMGRVWRQKGDLKLALEYLERGQELFEQAEDARGISGSLDDIGAVLFFVGRYDEAYAKVTEGLSRRGKTGDPRSIAHSLSNLGNIQKNRGRFAEALNCHREALEMRRDIGDRAGVIASLNNLAVLAYERGNSSEARRGWEQALTEAEEIGALPLQALALANLGELALHTDRAEEARRRLEEALDIGEDIEGRLLIAESCRNLALLENNEGDPTAAREYALRSHQVAADAGLRDQEGQSLLTLGEIYGGSLFDPDRTDEFTETDDKPAADNYFADGLELLREIGNEGELAKGLERYGRYKIEHGEVPEGRTMLKEALDIFTRLGMAQGKEVQKMLAAV